MIASKKPPASGYTHTLSNNLLRAALMSVAKPEGWQAALRSARDAELATDSEMRAFAEEHADDIATLVMQGQTAIYIHRSLSHGLELFTDD